MLPSLWFPVLLKLFTKVWKKWPVAKLLKVTDLNKDMLSYAKQLQKNSYQEKGIDISADDIFISDGSKCDTGNIQEIFGNDNKIAICDPVYPVYADTTVMAGKTGACQANGHYDGIIYMPCTIDNGFIPKLPTETPDLIFLCYPNNPTGTVASKEELKKWVDFAIENKKHYSLRRSLRSFYSK